MIPSESESLVATGLDNSYIKLSPEAASSLLDSSVDKSGAAEISTETTTTSIDGTAVAKINSKNLPVILNPEQLTIVQIKANGSKTAAKMQ